MCWLPTAERSQARSFTRGSTPNKVEVNVSTAKEVVFSDESDGEPWFAVKSRSATSWPTVACAGQSKMINRKSHSSLALNSMVGLFSH
jgi:hypothetical protein